MTIKNVTKGHLTPTNKKHIKVLFSRGLNEGTINGITYYISQRDSTSEYVVKVIKKDNSIILGEPFRIETAYFTI